MRPGTHWEVVGLCLLLGACGARDAPARAPAHAAQSYCEAIELMCQVDQRAGIDTEADILERSELRAGYISDHVKNPDAIYFRTLWSVKPPKEQAAELRKEAESSGVAGCPLAEALAREEL